MTDLEERTVSFARRGGGTRQRVSRRHAAENRRNAALTGINGLACGLQGQQSGGAPTVAQWEAHRVVQAGKLSAKYVAVCQCVSYFWGNR